MAGLKWVIIVSFIFSLIKFALVFGDLSACHFTASQLQHQMTRLGVTVAAGPQGATIGHWIGWR